MGPYVRFFFFLLPSLSVHRGVEKLVRRRSSSASPSSSSGPRSPPLLLRISILIRSSAPAAPPPHLPTPVAASTSSGRHQLRPPADAVPLLPRQDPRRGAMDLLATAPHVSSFFSSSFPNLVTSLCDGRRPHRLHSPQLNGDGGTRASARARRRRGRAHAHELMSAAGRGPAQRPGRAHELAAAAAPVPTPEHGGGSRARTRARGGSGNLCTSLVPLRWRGRGETAHGEAKMAASSRAAPPDGARRRTSFSTPRCTDKEGRRKKKNLTYGPML